MKYFCSIFGIFFSIILNAQSLPVAVAENKVTTSLTAYPNPSTGTFSFHVDVATTQVLHVSLVNVLGETVYNREIFTQPGEHCLEVSIPWGCVDGMYMLKVEGDDFFGSDRVIIHHQPF
jgi:hypothetical protein